MFMYYITLAFTLPADIYFISWYKCHNGGHLSKMFYSVLYFNMTLLTNLLDCKITWF